MRLSHEQPAPSSPPSTSLRDRVRGQAAKSLDPPAPDLTRTLAAIRQDAAAYFEALAQSGRGLLDWDHARFETALRHAYSGPITQAWNESDYTLPQRPSAAPVKRCATREQGAS